MFDHSTRNQDEPTMLSEMLQRLHAAGKLDVGRLADDLCVARQTIYNYMSGISDPSITIACRMYRVGSDELRRELDLLFHAGTNRSVIPVDDLDANGDGRIDHRDALAACAQSVALTAEAIQQMASCTDDHHTLDTLHELHAEAIHSAAALVRAGAIINHIIEHRGTRKRCRPLPNRGNA